ncbi:helix-turn-helix transcriptional regulator [Paenibacillus chibensis]|uniref:helix-turn-helix transcriptional regulator n=1 Tax=Paenibacillus chibensis TaxID=59846 RepID=UPI002DBC344C|nr:AraC family transcriptional regulator [Paenibacillus chibensis]MEC0369118.1 AraC family transcriptional regulator [Paenibacillus chibensis]
MIDLIHSHLDTELRLQVLAAVAGFSPYHFHRIFKGIVGEKLDNFIQRKRVEKAASILLCRPDIPVTENALHCGFSSSSVFARVFRAHFGMSTTDICARMKKRS